MSSSQVRFPQVRSPMGIALNLINDMNDNDKLGAQNE